ncbi:hypothetical protein Q9966_015785 [Columba livia]|nr:hypothetical protein Q9966_015785 [Columba livia]
MVSSRFLIETELVRSLPGSDAERRRQSTASFCESRKQPSYQTLRAGKPKEKGPEMKHQSRQHHRYSLLPNLLSPCKLAFQHKNGSTASGPS